MGKNSGDLGDCLLCGKNKPGVMISRRISFFSDLVVKRVTITKSFSECAACAKEKWRKQVLSMPKAIFRLDEKDHGIAGVNWFSYFEAIHGNPPILYREKLEKLHQILLDIGVLSLEPKRHYTIVSDGLGMGNNPTLRGIYLYFVCLDDALSYVVDPLSSQTNVNIQKISRVISVSRAEFVSEKVG